MTVDAANPRRTFVPDLEAIRFAKLRGKYKHYCPDWDYLAIDETCPEWEACLCHTNKRPYLSLWVITTSLGLFAFIWLVVLAVANYIFGIDLLPL